MIDGGAARWLAFGADRDGWAGCAVTNSGGGEGHDGNRTRPRTRTSPLQVGFVAAAGDRGRRRRHGPFRDAGGVRRPDPARLSGVDPHVRRLRPPLPPGRTGARARCRTRRRAGGGDPRPAPDRLGVGRHPPRPRAARGGLPRPVPPAFRPLERRHHRPPGRHPDSDPAVLRDDGRGHRRARSPRHPAAHQGRRQHRHPAPDRRHPPTPPGLPAGSDVLGRRLPRSAGRRRGLRHRHRVSDAIQPPVRRRQGRVPGALALRVHDAARPPPGTLRHQRLPGVHGPRAGPVDRRQECGPAGDRLAGAEKGLSAEDAYILCSLAADLKISQIVDQPNWGVSAYLSLAVFH